jgi:glutamate-1-semialdehyde 2,1-aminomutase
MKTKNSQKLYKKAINLMPGGVNSPVRAFKAVGGNPIFIKKAKGSKIYDVDGNQYIDYVLSWGSLILGHAYPSVVKALKKAIERGTSYGAPTELEIKLAELIKEAFPSIEIIRMVNSGTEATMSAIRVARGFTKRSKVIKFEGCYHGHVDGLLVSAGSGGATLGIPDSLGIPSSYVAETIVLPFNDSEAFKNTLKEHGKDIACVIVEPVVGNMGCILPKEDFLITLRKETEKYGVLLIFDEVMTGFRVSFGGAQAFLGITPDLTCVGKVVGGGLPVGAYGGKKEIMQLVAPEGAVYQAGTLSGNPLAMTAGVETLKILKKSSTYKKLESIMAHLEAGLKDAAKKAGVKVKFYRAGTMFCTYFTETEVFDAKTAKTSDMEKFRKFFWGMLEKGIYIAPSQFEAGFISLSHSEKDIEKTIQATYKTFKQI